MSNDFKKTIVDIEKLIDNTSVNIKCKRRNISPVMIGKCVGSTHYKPSASKKRYKSNQIALANKCNTLQKLSKE